LRDARVLQEAIAAGVRSEDFFAYAHSVGERGRYEGLVIGEHVGAETVHLNGLSVLVKPDAALRQRTADEREQVERLRPVPDPPTDGKGDTPSDRGGGPTVVSPTPPPPRLKRRYYGSVEISALRALRDFEEIVNDVVQHLEALPDAEVKVTIGISAMIPDGAPDNVVRIVSENANQLKFRNSEFEET
jgi:hypothetical protein